MNPVHDGKARQLEALDRVRVSANGRENVTAIYVKAMADLGRVPKVVKRDGWVGWLKRRVGYVLGGEDGLVGERLLSQELATNPII